MNKKKLLQYIYLSLLNVVILFLSWACNEYNEPPLIYNPDSEVSPNSPAITSVIPEGTAPAGVREITIMGQNFMSGDTTWIFVGNNSTPVIKSISDTKIELYRPPNFGNPLEIKVVIPNAIGGIAKVSYNLEAPIDSISTFLAGSGLSNFSVMEIDKNGTFWTSSNRHIDTVSADGLFFGTCKDRTILPSAFSSVTDLKFGRKGFLYALVGRNSIYLISTAVKDSSKKALVYATVPGSVSKFDFDEQGNIYAGGSELYIVTATSDTTGEAVSTGQYSGINVSDVRVFNNYVYVSDEKNLWRSQINGTSLGNPELLANLDNAGLADGTIASFNLDVDGNVFLCLQNIDYSLYALENDGSITPYYVDNIVPLQAKQILWGYNNRYLYINRSGITSGMRVYLLGMEKKGAPNYGRDF